jgi:hypothetical protein
MTPSATNRTMAASPHAARSTIGAVVTGAEWRQIVAAAEAAGMARSAWMRAVIHAAINAPAPARSAVGQLDRNLAIHLSAGARDRVRALAEAQGISVSSWSRSQLIAHFDRDTEVGLAAGRVVGRAGPAVSSRRRVV